MRNSTDKSSTSTDKTCSTTELPPMPDVAKQDIAADVSALRDTFASGATKDIAQRKTLLRQLQRLMTEGEAAMKDAMWRDLHKHPTESFLSEIALLNAEIQDHLDYIDDWTTPEFALTNIANLPGLSYIHREPLGVACVIGTWNYPVNLLLTPLIAAISAGNCVLLRLPGDDTTRHLNNVLIKLLDQYMDRRFVRYVYGGVDETKAMLSEKFDVIFATGGCFLGKIVAKAAAETLTPTILELGGKSPAIIDASADIALAARRIAWGAFSNAGQTCVRPDYVLVDAKVGDAFAAALEATIKQFYGLDAQASDSYGRIINERSFERLHAVLEADRSSVTFGGASDASERYIAPTVLNFKRDFAAFEHSKAMEAELFGPLLPIYYYAEGNLDEPLAFVTKHEKPLALYVFTTNTTTSKRVTRDTSAGSMVVNDTMMQLTNPHIPFGGVGNSGMGAYHGRFGFEAFSHSKPVLHKYSLLDLPARYAPYSPATERVLRIVQYPFSRTFWRSVKFAAYAIALAVIAFGVKAASLDVKLARYVLANADERSL